MEDFFDVKPVDEARRALLGAWLSASGRGPRPLDVETLPLLTSLGRVLARDVVSAEDVPPRPRSTVDGFAVLARDTFGASDSLPAMLEIVQDVVMGQLPAHGQSSGQASRIPTGGMLPEGASACVMIEHTDMMDERTVLVQKPASPGDNVVQQGEDVSCGDVVLRAGRILSPFDLGALAALGIARVPVLAKPVVAVISTGDEIVPADETPGPGRIRDINTYSLAASVTRAGALPLILGISPDTYPSLRSLVEAGLEQADMVVVSGGSSVGTRDVAVNVFSDLGPPGVVIHGVALKPGKPVILGLCRGKPVFGLPGHPVSALTAFDLFVRHALDFLTARSAGDESLASYLSSSRESWVAATLTRNVSSAPGREDHVRVRLREEDGATLADPVLGKSGLITTLVDSDGEIVVPSESEGVLAGTVVKVRLLKG